ncbi:MAG TPA: sigma-70 family RNA polymerase sigma factor [Candidatus Dormibacteraeota bacterium]|jgi:RNA polymerase sigma factor (sigma-70 family)|nr:sigma-70 family RNA polymerase sigma factor [Candidatus Dormibacteraeota bacterium]
MTTQGESFPLTRYSVLAAAGSSDNAERSRALDILFAAYWKPIYKYLRLKYSQAPQDAQDLTQGFFAELLERKLLSRFDPAKSRLRTYLRLCADSFALNEIKAASRKKRGGEFAHVPLDFSAAEDELRAQTIDPAAIPSPESLEDFFEKEWIRSLFSSAVEELRKLCEARGKQKAFALFESYDLDGEENISYAELATRHSMSATDVNNQMAWARREFRRIATERLRALSGSEEEFARESKSLFGEAPK